MISKSFYYHAYFRHFMTHLYEFINLQVENWNKGRVSSTLVCLLAGFVLTSTNLNTVTQEAMFLNGCQLNQTNEYFIHKATN